MDDSVTEWLLAWFKKKGSLSGRTKEEWLQTPYFKVGLIDSLGIIQLIAEVEGHFRIRFGPGDFNDPRFQTIGGLCEIVSELYQLKKT